MPALSTCSIICASSGFPAVERSTNFRMRERKVSTSASASRLSTGSGQGTGSRIAVM